MRAMPELSDAKLEEERKQQILDRVNRSKWFLERKRLKLLKSDTIPEKSIDKKRERLQSMQSSVDRVLERIVPKTTRMSNTAPNPTNPYPKMTSPVAASANRPATGSANTSTQSKYQNPVSGAAGLATQPRSSLSETTFQEMLKKLVIFKSERGHCNVQCKDPKYADLGRWVSIVKMELMYCVLCHSLTS